MGWNKKHICVKFGCKWPSSKSQ